MEYKEMNEWLKRYRCRFEVKKSRAKLGSLICEEWEVVKGLQWRMNLGKIKSKMKREWGWEYMLEIEPVRWLFKKVEGKEEYGDG